MTNIGIALGFIGKQSAAAGSVELIQGLAGMKGLGKAGFARKRAIVSAMQSAGISGKGAMMQALAARGGVWGTRQALQSLFATQVATEEA